MKKGTGKYTPALILYLLMAGTAIHAETQTETSAMTCGAEEGTELCGQPIPATTPGAAENPAVYTLNRYTQSGQKQFLTNLHSIIGKRGNISDITGNEKRTDVFTV